MTLLNSMVNLIMRSRLNEIEAAQRSPEAVQHAQLLRITESAQDTDFGRKHGFAGIYSIESFQQRAPVQEYADCLPYIERMMAGEANVLCPSAVKWFAKSSGTTGEKSKFIPVSTESLNACHYRGPKDVLALYLSRYPDSGILTGKGLTLGGSHSICALNNEVRCGDLSAILIENEPFISTLIRTPSKETALLSDFEEKIACIARETVNEHIVQFAGVPSWNLTLMHYILNYTGKSNLLEVWNDLELFIHGGISFEPYREQYSRLIPSDAMHYMETYNASEGFFAIQDNPDDEGLLLMLDYGIFYEFIPLAQIEDPHPSVCTIADVKQGVNYAMLITTLGGLYRYIIGDTVEFISLNPHKIKITGRTKHFINAFGEELMVYNTDAALREACEATGAAVRDYTAAPVFMAAGTQGCHQYLVEFERMPSDMALFVETLDRALQQVNSDYEAKRLSGATLGAPQVKALPQGTFYRWLQQRGKLGGQNKVPRLYNNRLYADQLIEFAAE